MGGTEREHAGCVLTAAEIRDEDVRRLDAGEARWVRFAAQLNWARQRLAAVNPERSDRLEDVPPAVVERSAEATLVYGVARIEPEVRAANRRLAAATECDDIGAEPAHPSRSRWAACRPFPVHTANAAGPPGPWGEWRGDVSCSYAHHGNR